jgi:hypothetical protein
MPSRRTASGVNVADDFRDNLIIDRYDSELDKIGGKKLRDLHSENSEDVVTWNVFRTLKQLDHSAWWPKLFQAAFHVRPPVPVERPEIKLWPLVSPPPRLPHKEGQTQVDIMLGTSTLVWTLEAKYKSDIDMNVKYDSTRDQVLRNIDVGSHCAADKDYYFSLLYFSAENSPEGVKAVARYSATTVAAERLAYRSDKLANVRGVSKLTWSDLAGVLAACREAVRPGERAFIDAALAWLAPKGIVPHGGTL